MKIRPHVSMLWALAITLVFLALFYAMPSLAAVVGEWRVNLLRGTSTFATITGATPDEAWDSCVQRIAAQPAGTTTWTCQTPRFVARVVADPPSTCTAPQPAPVTETRECPVGTTGSWTQTQAFVSAPYPTCWTAGPWVSAEAPAGACVTPPPPPTGDWVHCANQGEVLCSAPIGAYSGTRIVRYGIDVRWIEREFPSGVGCNSTVFGGNPASGVTKVCQVRGTTAPPPPEEPPPPATGTATLNWTPPATMSDGTPATLASFRIRYGMDSANLSRAQDVPNVTTATVDSLSSGTWHFTVSALDTQGRESLPSNTASKVVQ